MKKKGFTHESQSALSVEWYTPKWVFDELGLAFDVDVCAPAGGVEWIPSRQHFHRENCGLANDWAGTVWCNPPYGSQTALWLERMAAHKDGVALVFARTDCAWFHNYVAAADAILFMKGRIRFVDAFGVSGGSGAGSGSMLVAWGDKCVSALEKMEQNGLGFLTRGKARMQSAASTQLSLIIEA